MLKDKKYQLAMERNIGAFEKKRGIFIINVKGKSIKPYSLIERYTNYENALGYGASPHPMNLFWKIMRPTPVHEIKLPIACLLRKESESR